MGTLSVDTEMYVESTLVDISALPLSELSLWRGPEMCAALRDVVRRSGLAQVWDQTSSPPKSTDVQGLAG